jgi:hypothetical protein
MATFLQSKTLRKHSKKFQKGDKPYKIMMARFILQEIVFQQ